MSLGELVSKIQETDTDLANAKLKKDDADREYNRLGCRLLNLRSEFTRKAAKDGMLDRNTLNSIPNLREPSTVGA